MKRIDENTMRLTIRDTGIGISEKVNSNLFNPFTRGEVSQVRGVGATGLGLVITQSLVRMMNGNIEVRSTQGQGTEVVLDLPISAQDGPRTPPDIAGLKVVWLLERGLPFPYWFSVFFTRCNAEFQVLETDINLAGVDPVSLGARVFILEAFDPKICAKLRVLLKQKCLKAKVILLCAQRVYRIGQLGAETSQIQVYPILASELQRAFAFAGGWIQPVDVIKDGTLQKIETSQTSKDRRSGMSTLIVEDNEINQLVLLKQPEILGYPTAVARNGEQGLAKWQGDRLT